MARARHRPAAPASSHPQAEMYPHIDEELLKTLPTVLRAVVRALGFGRASEWLLDHGGVNVNIPMFHTQALGLMPGELARLRATLAPHLDAAGRVWMPKADKLYRRVRDAQMRKERRNASINIMARRYRLSSRQITNICREGDKQQLDLF